ncbi:Type-F conjugative transfer system protein [Legionella santicrucis]|uniref:Type-F conjugative transfer system protein n=1 Tax=Legionella santicrucis TaxID=45074 RepID=A0A0W0ZBM1_9GAMM|nr:type-F conjugative transfer system protein TraW [Legionella santicrucis]KTD66471.1 Type-F conjugative transfer system protein [Legionella santicrucis]
MKRLFGAVISMSLCCTCSAKSLGVLGHTFPVKEKSLLVLISERVQMMQKDGQWEDLERRWKDKVSSRVLRPSPLNLMRAKQNETHYYLPEAIAYKDILNDKGEVIVSKGTRVNALSQLPSYSPVWLFINFDDPAQQRFAQRIIQKHPEVDVILTGGNVAEAEQQTNQPIYFDQEARITAKLKINHVPALVTRINDSLKIEELVIGENGHAL